MLARVGSASDEDIHVTVAGMIENVAGEWWMGKRNGERKIGNVCIWGGGGGGFWYAFLVCFEKKGFCGQRRFEFGGKRGGFYRLWQKLNSDG